MKEFFNTIFEYIGCMLGGALLISLVWSLVQLLVHGSQGEAILAGAVFGLAYVWVRRQDKKEKESLKETV